MEIYRMTVNDNGKIILRRLYNLLQFLLSCRSFLFTFKHSILTWENGFLQG